MINKIILKMTAFLRRANAFFLSLSLLAAAQLGAQTTDKKNNFNVKTFPYADVHMHASFKPFNSRLTGDYNMWDKIDHDCEGEISSMFLNGSKEVPKTSQCHLEGLARGNVRLGFLSLTPLEKGSLDVNFFNEKKKGIGTMACISGIMLEKMVGKDETIDYYADLVENIYFVERDADKPHYIDGVPYSFEIIKTSSQLEKVMADPHKLAIIMHIEGGHALGHSLEPNDISSTIAYENYYMNNVDRIKGIKPISDGSLRTLEYPILSLNINHFFWNGLSGHARTFSNAQNIIFGQNKGIDMGVTKLGEKVIKRLLDKEHGRRILLDIKHMSLETRRWYYDYLHELAKKGDTVAIVSSHSTVAGLSWSDKEYLKKDNNAKDKNAYLYNWTISLCDEDIKEIHRSKGNIGIMLDKNRLMGGLAKKIYDETVPGSTQRRKVAVKILWLNFFTCVKAINEPSAWDILSVGTDFDGMITPFEFYPRANEMPDMAADMYEFLKNPTDLFDMPKSEVERLMFGISPEEIIRKVMFDNAYQFALRNLPK